MHSLSQEELMRYARHLTLKDIGPSGQQRLKSAKVICIGAGGLGCPALLYLAAAGVGTIGIVDHDDIDLSNLQRQILFTTEDVGKPKAEIAKKRLLDLNPHLKIIAYQTKLTHENVFSILNNYDVVIDATDNYASRYLINDACYTLKKPDIFAGISQFTGQCSVFALPNQACYRCLFPEIPSLDAMPNCQEAGVLGVLPGILGNLQALEAIKFILGIGQTMAGRLLTIDALSMRWQEFSLSVNPNCVLCSKQKTFDEIERPLESCVSNLDISPEEFFDLRMKNISYLLLDVRDEMEYREKNLGGYLIPLSELSRRATELNKEQMIIVHCQIGGRSLRAVKWLKENGFQNVRNLKGGISAVLSPHPNLPPEGEGVS